MTVACPDIQLGASAQKEHWLAENFDKMYPTAAGVPQSGKSLRNEYSARFPARSASAIVSKKIFERSMGLVLPVR